MDNFKINPVKIILRLKQWAGWFIAILFPFAAWGIVKFTNSPILVALIYWIGIGILLRFTFDKKLPIFHPQIRKVKKEIVVFVIITIIGGYYYSKGVKIETNAWYLIFNSMLYGFVNGFLEILAWVNIVDLAGARIKLNGYLALFLYVALIDGLFWSRFMPQFPGSIYVLIIIQLVMLITGLSVYKKTEDVTIWSIQHILFNLLVIMLTGFGVNLFIHI
ncbi:MAG: hypothetical protein WCQ54_07445 [Clostridiaceae bacterium]